MGFGEWSGTVTSGRRVWLSHVSLTEWVVVVVVGDDGIRLMRFWCGGLVCQGRLFGVAGRERSRMRRTLPSSEVPGVWV